MAHASAWPTPQLQEQLTLKPSVAKKLNERIRSLEIELEITRNESRVDELERKVAVRVLYLLCHVQAPRQPLLMTAPMQKLELELKQSYATKNFTLKSGV